MKHPVQTPDVTSRQNRGRTFNETTQPTSDHGKVTKLNLNNKENWAQKMLLKRSWMTIKQSRAAAETEHNNNNTAMSLEWQQRQNAQHRSLKYAHPRTEITLGLHPNNHNNVTFSLQLPPLSHPPSASPPYLSFLMGMRQINVNTGFTYHTVASTTLQGIEWKQAASPFNAGCKHS